MWLCTSGVGWLTLNGFLPLVEHGKLAIIHLLRALAAHDCLLLLTSNDSLAVQRHTCPWLLILSLILFFLPLLLFPLVSPLTRDLWLVLPPRHTLSNYRFHAALLRSLLLGNTILWVVHALSCLYRRGIPLQD